MRSIGLTLPLTTTPRCQLETEGWLLSLKDCNTALLLSGAPYLIVMSSLYSNNY